MGIAVLFMQRVPVFVSLDDRAEAGRICTREFWEVLLAATVGLGRSTEVSTELGSSQRGVRVVG